MRVTLDQQGLNELLASPQGPVVREMASLTRRTQNRAKQKVGVDTNRLRSSITGVVNTVGNKVVGTVGSSVQYAGYHHQGTGVYGPAGRPIRARPGRVLAFRPKGSQTIVYTREVQGSRPNPFLLEALREVLPGWTITENR